MRSALSVAIGAALAASACSVPRSGSSAVIVSDAWVREAAPGQPSTAAYATLTNPTDAAITLAAASAAVAQTLEFHETQMDAATMRMVAVRSVVVPPRGRVDLQPGGLHLMLLGLTKPCPPGDRLTIEFRFSDGLVVASAEVRRRLESTP